MGPEGTVHPFRCCRPSPSAASNQFVPVQLPPPSLNTKHHDNLRAIPFFLVLYILHFHRPHRCMLLQSPVLVQLPGLSAGSDGGKPPFDSAHRGPTEKGPRLARPPPPLAGSRRRRSAPSSPRTCRTPSSPCCRAPVSSSPTPSTSTPGFAGGGGFSSKEILQNQS